MRQIVFHEVGMENFGPYIDPMVLTFENDKLTLITGPNGIGKTMALEAIPFTLFGETCKKAKGDDVVNTRVGRNCHTWVKFSVDADNYLVDRYHKYTKLQNTVTIRKNLEDPYLKGHREVLPEIEKLICSKKSFTNTLMFGQKVKDFFTDLIDSDKKEIFRKILDLDIYTTWYKSADADLKEKLDRKKLDATDHDVEHLQTQLNDVEKQIAHHDNEKENTILKLQRSRDSKISEIRESANKATQAVIDKHRQTYDLFFESHSNEIKELTEEHDSARSGMMNHTNKIAELSTEKRITQNDINNLNESLEIEGGVCPTCLQDIGDDCREHLESEVSDSINRYKEFERQEKAIQKSIKTYEILIERNTEAQLQQNKQFGAARSDLTQEETDDKVNIERKVNATIEKINKLAGDEALKIERDYDKYVETLQKKFNQLQGIKEVVSDTAEKIKEIDSTISGLEQSIKNIEVQVKLTEEDEYDKSQLAAYQMRKGELEKSIEEMNQGVVDLQSDQNLSEFWKAAWSPTGIPSMLIDESIPFMNEKVSDYLDRLTNGRYIVSFDTLAATKKGEFRDKISVNVLDTHTRANSRIQLSGGQTRIVDIATILTLGDLQSNVQDVNINILLFDEIFDSLDEENIGFVSNILSQLKVGKSIYLISHTQVDQLEADEILELK